MDPLESTKTSKRTTLMSLNDDYLHLVIKELKKL